jgi:RNA-binding protein
VTPLTGKERAVLRAAAHQLRSTVHVGQLGVTATVRESVDEQLRARELVKLQVGRGAPAPARAVAEELAGSLGAEVIQVIGRTATLYRKNPDLARRPDGLPAWTR